MSLSLVVPPRFFTVARTLTRYILPRGHPGYPNACEFPLCRRMAPNSSKQSIGSQNELRVGVRARKSLMREPKIGVRALAGRSASRLPPNACQLGMPWRRASQTPVGRSNISRRSASFVVPIGSREDFSRFSTGQRCTSSLDLLVRWSAGRIHPPADDSG